MDDRVTHNSEDNRFELKIGDTPLLFSPTKSGVKRS